MICIYTVVLEIFVTEKFLEAAAITKIINTEINRLRIFRSLKNFQSYHKTHVSQSVGEHVYTTVFQT